MSYMKDEILVAYADDALSLEEARTVEHMLTLDPEARRSVLLFKLTRVYVQKFFEDIDSTRMSLKLAAILEPDRSNSAAASWLRVRRHGVAWMLPLAACLALAVGVAAVQRGVVPDVNAAISMLGPVDSDSAVFKVLNEDGTAGTVWLTGDGSRIIDVSEFKDKFDNVCRELEIYGAASRDVPIEVIIACRNSRGGWSVVGGFATQPAGMSSGAFYVPTESQARMAMDGILTIIGTQQRTSTARTE